MLWVLKRTALVRRFFEHPKHMLQLMDKNCFFIKIYCTVQLILYGPTMYNRANATLIECHVEWSREIMFHCKDVYIWLI